LYAIYGFFLGVLFPFSATVLKFQDFGIPFSLRSLLVIHLTEPIMLILDTAPIVMAASFSLIGIQSARAHKTSRQLTESEERIEEQTKYEHLFLDALIQSTSFAIVRLDRDHHIITCNRAFEDLFGYKGDDIVGEHLDDMIAADDLHEEASSISASVSAGNLERKISKRMRKDGSLVDVEIVGVPVTVGGERIGILGLYHDISPRVNAERALRESEARYRSLFHESPISLWEEDFSGAKQILEQHGDREQILEKLHENYDLVYKCIEAIKIIDVNQATLDLYNASSKAELIESMANIFVIESLDEFRNELTALVNGETTFDCEIYNKKITGELIYGDLRLSVSPGYEDTWERVQISILDITDRKEAEEKLRFMSFHDALTGLYNRAYFEEELTRLAGSRQYPVSIITCDLDGLKQINDQHGHDAGDRAIKSVAKILGLNSFRKEDMVARIGGDEFVIILPTVDLDENPAIIKRIRQGIDLHNQSTIEDDLFRPISLSIGYAVVSEKDSLQDGYKKADAAMYVEKSSKKAAQ
jgi:diguanylate cyclase (GGDEF)-like protein/PAS domain S-box-containing protein